jgi:hypothetical protein
LRSSPSDVAFRVVFENALAAFAQHAERRLRAL